MQIYFKKILQYPKFILIFFLSLFIASVYFSKNFDLDASAQSLLLENDPDLKYLRELNERYGSEEFFIITYSSKEKVNKNIIKNFETFVSKINTLEWVSKTVSVINTPLLQNSNEPLMDRIKNLKYIINKDINFNQALNELVKSPVYRDLVISADGKTLGLIVYLKDDNEYLNAIKLKNSINKNDKNKLKKIDLKIKDLREKQSDNISKYNKEIKSLIAQEKIYADINLSGIPMIADDMISFVKKDLIIFGIGVLLFIILSLYYIFRKVKFIILPLLICFLSIALMIGLISFLKWPVTVISSNFTALMLILTMSMNIHVLVKFVQYKDRYKNLGLSLDEIIIKSCSEIFYPVLFAVLTTICAFMSLIISDIKPIISFGYMMTYGLIISFITTFLLLPILLKKFETEVTFDFKKNNINFVNIFYKIYQNKIVVCLITFFSIIISVYGIQKLNVENSFINYFDKDTEIYKGMKKIDQDLGGTTPLEIILKFKDLKNDTSNDGFLGEIKTKVDNFLGEEQSSSDNEKYWFTRDKVDKIIEVHKYLENRPEIGKVLSFYSILNIAESLNSNKKLGSLEMGVLYQKLPTNIKEQIIKPYISIKNNEARISLRIKDSSPNLKRKELLYTIEKDLIEKIGLKKQDFKIAGVMVIFNNLLQSLFDSQIKSLGLVMVGIFIMFVILFRSLKLAIIGIVPNILSASLILGIIGALNIPLDMMTITIAAITIGIAVDDTIHYIYKYKSSFTEFSGDKLIMECHNNVGKAIISTSVTIIFGFSILVLSNFIPTIYFGLFTGLAMFIALLFVLTLLPHLLNLIYRKSV